MKTSALTPSSLSSPALNVQPLPLYWILPTRTETCSGLPQWKPNKNALFSCRLPLRLLTARSVESCVSSSAPFSHFLVFLNHSVWPLPHQSAPQITSGPVGSPSHFPLPLIRPLFTSHPHILLPTPQVVSGVNKEGGTSTTFCYMDI